MEININKFQVDTAKPVEVPLDFATLCALLAQHQAATPTAKLARGENPIDERTDHNPAIDVLLAGSGQPVSATAANASHGSFHQAAAALFSDRT